MASINLASAFSNKLQEAFKQTSLTDSATGKDYSFSGLRSIKIWSVDTVPLTDYKRSGMSRYGDPTELGDTVQEMTMRADKAFSMTIDKGNQSDQMNIKGATRAAKRETEQVVIPYLDKYRMNEWCSHAGIINGLSAAPTKNTIIDAIFDADEKMSDALVPAADRTLFVTNAMYKLLCLSDQFVGINDLGKVSIAKGDVGEVCGMRVKRVPGTYMPNGVYFFIKYKGSTVDPMKLNELNIHDNPPGISGNLVEGRVYHDSFVLEKKASGIYVAAAAANVTAAPSLTESSGSVTITGSGVVKYTVDGSDPRYSASAQVYSAAFKPGKGVTVKAYAVDTGKMQSAVAAHTAAS